MTTESAGDCDLNSSLNSIEVDIDLSLTSLMEIDFSDLLRSVIANPPVAQPNNDELSTHLAPQQDVKEETEIGSTPSFKSFVGSMHTTSNQLGQELINQLSTSAREDEVHRGLLNNLERLLIQKGC